MDLTHMAIIILASMIFVLSGMVGYLYWQQTRIMQHLQSLSFAVTSLSSPIPIEVELTEDDVQETEIPESDEEDDRASIVSAEAIERVNAPPTATAPAEDDVDDIQHKTVKQLHEILSKKGIPFGKRDSKPILLELLKATT